MHHTITSKIHVTIKQSKLLLLSYTIWYETGSLILSEEHRFEVFENGILRRIFGSKRKEVVGGWKRLHNEELHNLYGSPHIIRVIKSRRMRWVGHVARMGETRNIYKILVGKSERKRSLGRQRH
jgi:hypothetical protein